MAGINEPEQARYVILLHPQDGPSFIARRTFPALSLASDHLHQQLKRRKDLRSGRVYKMEKGELVKIIDVYKELVIRITWHDTNTNGVVRGSMS